MKKQINPAIKAHLIRGAFYLLLLVTICVIPFAFAQRNAVNRGMSNAARNLNLAVSQADPSSRLFPYDLRLARTSNYPRATALTPHVLPVPQPPKAPQDILYDQYNNAATTVTVSAAFTDFPNSSADLADDFVVPAGETWNVDSIDADGAYFECPSEVCPGATNWNVFIYADAGGLPGTQVYSILNQPVTVVGTTFTVNLSPAAVLTSGTYWIEIQPNMTFVTQGEWGWTDRTLQSNSAAAWQNPGGDFGGCLTWAAKLTCPLPAPTPGGPDQVYRINGTTSAGGTPTATPTGTPSSTPTPTSAGTPTATPTGSPACSPTVINGSIDLTDPVQTDTLNRSGIAQTCPATTSCQVFGDGLMHHYDSYTFTNTTGSTQCVTIDTNAACTGPRFIFTAAYLGSFDPNNVCTNWIGDSGFSPNPDIAFQVNVDDGQTLVVVVSNVTAEGTCPAYTLTVTGLCSAFTPSPTPTATGSVSASPTATSTATVTATPTVTPTATARATPTPRRQPTPRPRPTPVPRV
jgi:hypothetical protein